MPLLSHMSTNQHQKIKAVSIVFSDENNTTRRNAVYKNNSFRKKNKRNLAKPSSKLSLADLILHHPLNHVQSLTAPKTPDKDESETRSANESPSGTPLFMQNRDIHGIMSKID